MLARTGRPDNQGDIRRQMIADAMTEVCGELRLIDLAGFIAFIHAEAHPNLNDLIDSSVELYFAPGVLTYGWGAAADLRWGSQPIVKLDMEFRFSGVTAFFGLLVGAPTVAVELHYIAFEPRSSDPARNTARLGEALTAARRTLAAAAPAPV
jgi:hypothetical protein